MTIGHDCKPVRNAARFFRERLSNCRSSEPDTPLRIHQPRPPPGGSLLLTNDGRGHSRTRKPGSIQLGSSVFLIVRDAQIVEVEIYFGWSIPHEAKGFEKLTERFGQVMNSKGERNKFTASSFLISRRAVSTRQSWVPMQVVVAKWLRLVPRAGVEPARPFGQRILSPQRLPFRHPGTKW